MSRNAQLGVGQLGVMQLGVGPAAEAEGPTVKELPVFAVTTVAPVRSVVIAAHPQTVITTPRELVANNMAAELTVMPIIASTRSVSTTTHAIRGAVTLAKELAIVWPGPQTAITTSVPVRLAVTTAHASRTAPITVKALLVVPLANELSVTTTPYAARLVTPVAHATRSAPSITHENGMVFF